MEQQNEFYYYLIYGIRIVEDEKIHIDMFEQAKTRMVEIEKNIHVRIILLFTRR